jgi:hypothetical protein
MEMNDFKCEKCNQTFLKKYSDEKAEKEYASAPYNVLGHERAVICDKCFIAFKKWFSTLNEEQHKKIRNE